MSAITAMRTQPTLRLVAGRSVAPSPRQFELTPPPPSAAESIDAIHELFRQHHGTGKARRVFEQMSEYQRRVLCFAAGLKQRHLDTPLDQWDHTERKALCHAVRALAELASGFGEPMRLTATDFQ